MKLRLKISLDILIFNTILVLLYIKLIFSYLTVDHGWWLRDIPSNADRFNFLGVPSEISNQAEYIITPLLFLYLLLRYKTIKRLSFVLQIILLMLTLNFITSVLSGVGIIQSITYTLKIITPVFFFYAFLIFYRNNHKNAKKTVINIVKLCLLLTFIALLFFPNSINRINEQLPVFFGGIHTHSYVLASVFMAIAYFLYRRNSNQMLIVFLFASFLVMQVGYGVRTATILYLLFILALLYIKHDFFKLLALKIAIYVPILAFLAYLFFDLKYLNKYSSGRLDMYSDKFEMLYSSNAIQLLFGRGFKSDMIRTESWWWTEKGSHSDFLTFTIENGIFYLILFVLLIFSLIYKSKKPNVIILAIILGYFVSSLISNGIAVRPLAAYVFFMVFAYITLTTNSHNTIFNEQK
jgi:hypothetical protein